MEQRLGPEDANTALALDQLGEIYFEGHQYAEAGRLLHREEALSTVEIAGAKVPEFPVPCRTPRLHFHCLAVNCRRKRDLCRLWKN